MLTLQKGYEIQSRYVIHDVAGTGGYASVWRASDKQLNRDVALKRLLKTNFTSGSSELQRILDEARKHAQLVHTNIVQVYDVIEAEGEHLILMEYVDGPSLDKILRDNARQGALEPMDRAVALLRDILAGVSYAHDRNVVHRDLSPSNILLTSTGIPKIGDFGIARVLEPLSVTPRSRATTQGGTGNPNFMSPEQARGEAADMTSDLFMIGIIGHLLLGGRHPFAHPSGLFEIPELIRDEDFQPEMPRAPGVLSSSQQRLFREYAAVVMRLLNRERAGRYATAREAIEAIEAVTPTLDCPSCGERVPEHYRYCGFCGSDLAGGTARYVGGLPDTDAEPRTGLRSAEGLVDEGFALSEKKNWAGAIALYREAIELDPTLSRAYRNLGFALNRVGQYEEAASVLTTGLDLPATAPQHAASLFHERSLARASLKDYDGALQDIEAALAKSPSSLRSLYHKARIHLFRGESEAATTAARELLLRDPDHAGALRLLHQLSRSV